MTDELTPDEEKAFKSLPRERMPAGLEERVVGAMREHGFLAKRRRTIEFTNARVAGVLAAGVALMIGAYSIGLHRGGGEVVVTPPAVPPVEPYRAEAPVEAQESKQPAATGTLGKTDQPAAADEAAGKDAQPVEKSLAAEGRLESMEEESNPPGAGGADGGPPPRKVIRQRLSTESALDATVKSPAASAPEPATRPLTFLLNGKPVVVEAPDSVRVVQDEQGRMLIIYTSDGIIRIRLAD